MIIPIIARLLELLDFTIDLEVMSSVGVQKNEMKYKKGTQIY